MSTQAKTRILALVLFVLGGGATLFAGTQLMGVSHALGAHAPLFALDGSDGVGLMGGIAVLTFGIMCLLPAPQLGPGKSGKTKQAKSSFELAPLLMLFAAVCLVLTPLAPTIVKAIVSHAATGAGYVTCPRPNWPRHQPDRWALPTPAAPTALCPMTQARR